MDVRRQTVYKRNRRIEMTRNEFRMLELLMRHPGEVISRDEFLDKLWGKDVHVTPRNVDTRMGILRRKIEDDAEHPRYLVSVRGAGYKLDDTCTGS